MFYKSLIILLLAFVLGACTGTGTNSLEPDAQEVCASIETGDEICDAAARWTVHAAIYTEVNKAHLTAEPQILGIESYTEMVSRLNDAYDLLVAVDSGESTQDKAINVLDALVIDLIQVGVLEQGEPLIK